MNVTMQNQVERAKLPPRTEFQLYVPFDKRGQDNVVDFTEKKLLAISRKLKDAVKKEKVLALLVQYRAGKVAIAWTDGSPMFTAITKG